MIDQTIKDYMSTQPGIQYSARWLASILKEKQPLVSRALRRMVKNGLLHCQTKSEFDIEYSRKGEPVQCRRRRNYYWIPPV